ncbi:hypothetical protein [Candidatus Tisiphia endosymbiont of Hybos culiciformis]|uniref:hypothetical protein n=1 Tax=Candidatus Tisiphia endosymbiont of Hybos culiciformis TaxID=3139331 RepID=UPI003CCB6595
MFRPVLKTSVNAIYWISFFSGGIIASILISSIALILLRLLKSLTINKNPDKWIIKQKAFALVTVAIGNIIFSSLEELSRIDSPVVLSILSVFVFINILVIFYYSVLMLV